jgi:hypothetical protein
MIALMVLTTMLLVQLKDHVSISLTYQIEIAVIYSYWGSIHPVPLWPQSNASGGIQTNGLDTLGKCSYH